MRARQGDKTRRAGPKRRFKPLSLRERGWGEGAFQAPDPPADPANATSPKRFALSATCQLPLTDMKRAEQGNELPAKHE